LELKPFVQSEILIILAFYLKNMTRSQQIGLGLKTFGQATGFIFRNKLGWTFLVPVVLNIILFIIWIILSSRPVDYLKESLLNLIDLDKTTFFGGFIGGLLLVIFKVLLFFVFAYISGYIIIILMSPLLAYLSEKTEQILTGKKYSTSILQIIKDVIRGITIAIRNLLLEILFMIMAFLVSFIPVIGWIGTIVLFLVSSYYYGFSFIDYINERKKLTIRESISVGQKYKWIAISNGAVFSVSLFIPFCGTFISLFVSIIAVVAATLAMQRTNAYSAEPD
jgi:CysZ protein